MKTKAEGRMQKEEISISRVAYFFLLHSSFCLSSL